MIYGSKCLLALMEQLRLFVGNNYDDGKQSLHIIDLAKQPAGFSSGCRCLNHRRLLEIIFLLQRTESEVPAGSQTFQVDRKT